MPQTEHIKLPILVVNSNITGVATGMVSRSLWDNESYQTILEKSPDYLKQFIQKSTLKSTDPDVTIHEELQIPQLKFLVQCIACKVQYTISDYPQVTTEKLFDDRYSYCAQRRVLVLFLVTTYQHVSHNIPLSNNCISQVS